MGVINWIHHHSKGKNSTPRFDGTDLNHEFKNGPLYYQYAKKLIETGRIREAREIIFRGSNEAMKENNQDLAMKFEKLLNKL